MTPADVVHDERFDRFRGLTGDAHPQWHITGTEQMAEFLTTIFTVYRESLVAPDVREAAAKALHFRKWHAAETGLDHDRVWEVELPARKEESFFQVDALAPLLTAPLAAKLAAVEEALAFANDLHVKDVSRFVDAENRLDATAAKVAEVEAENKRFREMLGDDSPVIAYVEDTIDAEKRLAAAEAERDTEARQHERLQRIYLAQCERTTAVEAERDRLKEYADHKPDCACRRPVGFWEPAKDCTCGIDAALAGGA